MTATGRRGRLFRRAVDAVGEEEAADLSEDQHAWWAAREGVNGVPRGPLGDEEEEPDESDPHFSDYWTAESLFDEPPARMRRGTPRVERPAPEPSSRAPGMDLDAAHLILQIRIGAEWDEITAAHRRLAKLYHPDRLIAFSREAQEIGRNRMAEINAAHASLRTLHFQ